MKIYHHPTLIDSICDLRTRKIKKSFFTQLNRLLDWEKISKIIGGIIIREKALQLVRVMMVYLEVAELVEVLFCV